MVDQDLVLTNICKGFAGFCIVGFWFVGEIHDDVNRSLVVERETHNNMN